MSLLSRLFGRTSTKNATVTLIGPSKSGKTTLVRYLETGETVIDDVHTTLGIEIRNDSSYAVDGWKLKAIDTGGQQLYQQTFWELAIQQADAVIFVIDATIKEQDNPEMYALSKEQFAYALDIIPEDMPLLVLLNKQDLRDKNPMGPKQAFQIFNLALFQNRTVAYLPTSAKFGDGVQEAMTWLVDKINI